MSTTPVIRYAIVIRPAAGGPDHYVGREGVLSSPGQATRFVEEAKTWGTEKGARKWMTDRPDWVAMRTKKGGTLDVVKVRMGTRVKSAPVALA